jgi:gamma-glutamylcyclotransferase (GGCT)/AIG2-like uncharacterized protein YtfP
MADKAKPTLRLVADKDLDRGCRNVFVYGTLKRSMSNHQPYLGDCRYIGESTAFGVLIHLGGFPALAEDSSGKCLVRGEVFELASPEHLVQLDRLEGVPHLYSRRQIVTEYGRAWTYFFSNPPKIEDTTICVAKGVWLGGRIDKASYSEVKSYFQGQLKVQIATQQEAAAQKLESAVRRVTGGVSPDSPLLVEGMIPESSPAAPLPVIITPPKTVPDRPTVGPGWEYG